MIARSGTELGDGVHRSGALVRRVLLLCAGMGAAGAACSAPDADVRAVRSDAVAPAVTAETTPIVPDETAVAAEGPLEQSFPATIMMPVGSPPDLSIFPLDETGTEAAIHALAPSPGGWRAVGSLTPGRGRGGAAVWDVLDDGTFGAAQTLPPIERLTSSVARDVVTVGITTIVGGYGGAGHGTVPVVWRDAGDGGWRSMELPMTNGPTAGAIVDEVLALADGTFVVVGRADGPSRSSVIFWWSSDDGLTWHEHVPEGVRSFIAPLVATDGTRIATLLRGAVGDDGLPTYESATFVWESGALRLDSHQVIDPSPGAWYQPKALVWDGAGFVGGFDTTGPPAFASSADGRTYELRAMELPDVTAARPSLVEGMVVVDGHVAVFIEHGEVVVGFRVEGDDLVPMELPHIVAGDLEYLEGRELMAADGLRLAYVASSWAGTFFLGWDSTTWTKRHATEVPPHRAEKRLEVRDVMANGDSTMALLVWSKVDGPDHFAPSPGGVMWKPPGSMEWLLLDEFEQIPAPVAMSAWHSGFVVAGVDFFANTTTLWHFDPVGAAFSRMGSVDGRVLELASGTRGLVARVGSAGGPDDLTTSLWHSDDGAAWTEVTLAGSATGLCSDGDRVVAVWTAQDGLGDTLGLAEVLGAGAADIGAPAVLEPNRLANGWRDSGRCALGEHDVLAVHVGNDGALTGTSPLSRLVPRSPSSDDRADEVRNVTGPGSGSSMILDVAWTGSGWVGVGTSRDSEGSDEATVWRSDDGVSWSAGEVIAGGPGHQAAWSVIVQDGQLLIGGFDVQTARFWIEPA